VKAWSTPVTRRLSVRSLPRRRVFDPRPPSTVVVAGGPVVSSPLVATEAWSRQRWATRARDLMRVVGERTRGPLPPCPEGESAGTPAAQLEALRGLATRTGDALSGEEDLTRYEAKVFSQNGEDGIIVELLRRIGAPTKWFVEFGAARGIQGNCVFLADVLGWKGLFIECGDEQFAALAAKYAGNPHIATLQAFVTPGSVEALFAQAGVPTEPDILSIDVDGADWWVWRAITSYRPRLVVIEYNASIDLDRGVTVPEDVGPWDGTAYVGASLGALEALAAVKGYRLVYTDLAGVNSFWVREDLADSLVPLVAPRRRANYWLRGGTLPPDPHNRPWIDVEPYLMVPRRQAGGETSR
jgi:hypothetical protein